MQYPEQKWDDQLPEYYRGVPPSSPTSRAANAASPASSANSSARPRPSRSSRVKSRPTTKWAKVEKRPKEFDIDMIRCIYCGMCEEVCPEQAIFLRQDYAITGTTREEMVHDKERLYEIGGVREGLVNKWNELK